MNSGTVLAGTDGCSRMTIGTRMMPATGAMSGIKLKLSLVVERGVDRVRNGGKQQRISVSGRVHDGLGADVAAGSRPVLDAEGLAQPLGQPLPDQPRRDVDPAAGGKTGDDAHRPRRIIERRCRSRQGWRDG